MYMGGTRLAPLLSAICHLTGGVTTVEVLRGIAIRADNGMMKSVPAIRY